jgi:hypothetical protein
MGLAAVFIGTVQVATSVPDLGSSGHILTTLMATLRLIVCGSLATVGALTLLVLRQEHQRSQREGRTGV